MMGSLQYTNTGQQADAKQVMGGGHEQAQAGRQRRDEIDDAGKTSRIAHGHPRCTPSLAMRKLGIALLFSDTKTYEIFGNSSDVLQADGSGQPFSRLN